MLESEFIKDTGVSINKMMEHTSKIPTPINQTSADSHVRPFKEQKMSHLPVKKDGTLSPAYRLQKWHGCTEHVVTRSTNIIKRNATSRGKRLSVPMMSSNVNVDITKDTNGNHVKFASKRPQSCYVNEEYVVLSEKKTEKSLSDETLNKNSKNKPLSRLPIRYEKKLFVSF